MGDEAAFEELLRQYSPRLRFYVAKMLGEKHERADDLLQEIWLSVFRALPRLNDAAAFRAWLFRIARDRVSREFRRARLKFDSLEGTEIEECAAESEGDEPVDAEVVRRQLAKLSPEHCEA